MKYGILAALSAAAILLSGCKDGGTSLFNGKNLDGWGFAVNGDSVDPAEVYTVRDGMIHISGNPFGYMYTLETFRNYDLDLEWAWDGNGTNSGIFLNISTLTNPFPKCVECNLKAGEAGMFVLLGGAMAEEYKLPEDGILPKFPRIDKIAQSSEKPDGEWNAAHIEVREGHIRVFINGVLQNECTSVGKEGHIGLQSEGGPVWFRNVTVKTIK